MSFHDDDRSRRRRRSDSARSNSAPDAGSAREPKRFPDRDVGQALRAAYKRVVDEDIPPEMLDLLGKLG